MFGVAKKHKTNDKKLHAICYPKNITASAPMPHDCEPSSNQLVDPSCYPAPQRTHVANADYVQRLLLTSHHRVYEIQASFRQLNFTSVSGLHYTLSAESHQLPRPEVPILPRTLEAIVWICRRICTISCQASVS